MGRLKELVEKKREFCKSKAEENYRLYLTYLYQERTYTDFFMNKFINSENPLKELDEIPKDVIRTIGEYKLLSEKYKERATYFMKLSNSKKLYFMPLKLILRKFK